MSRKKVERNISYDDVRKKYYVNLDFGIDPESGKQVKNAGEKNQYLYQEHHSAIISRELFEAANKTTKRS